MIAEATQKKAALQEWRELGNRMSPRIAHWAPFCGIGAGVMLYFFPASIIISCGLVLLSMLTFCLGYFTGISIFTARSRTSQRLFHPAKVRYILPIVLAVGSGIGVLGGGYWWVFATGVVFLGIRMGTKRAWWAAVTALARGMKSLEETFPLTPTPLYPTYADALAAAMDTIDKEIGMKS